MDNIIKTSMRYIIFQRNMACNSFFIRLKCYYLERVGTIALSKLLDRGLKVPLTFPLG